MPEGEEHFSMNWQVEGDTLTISIGPYQPEDKELVIDTLISWITQHRT